MKELKIISLTAFCFCCMAITGCTKKQSATGMEYPTTATNKGTSTLSYRFKTDDGILPQSGLRWTHGSFTVNKLTLNGNWTGIVDPGQATGGQQLKMDLGWASYSSNINATVGIDKTFIGGLMEVPAGYYSDVSVDMELGLTVITDNPDLPPLRLAVALTGSYLYKGRMVPITFIVEGPIMVNMKWNNGLALTGNNAYHPEIKLAINKLTADMPNALFNDATLTDGMIMIDHNTNSNLYNLMLANLPNVISVNFK